MGLDMYMIAKKFFWTEDYKTDRQSKEAEKIKKMFPEMKGKRLDYVIFQVGYWRKANHIHKWFVDNVQDGNDDCKDYYVDREKLQELKELCQEIIKDKELAKETLPTQKGFFFGGTEYDKYYFDDLKETIKIIDNCLSLPKEWEIEYHSSW
jgi:hypothetical protein